MAAPLFEVEKIVYPGLTNEKNGAMIQKTVDAEITAMMPSQRVRGAVSRIRNKLSNGPLRVQSNAFTAKYSATCWHTLVAGGMLVSCKVHGLFREFKVAPRIT